MSEVPEGRKRKMMRMTDMGTISQIGSVLVN
jgi:hypothetical protein